MASLNDEGRAPYRRRNDDPPVPLSARAIRRQQEASGGIACFQTDLRLLCRNERCEWRRECRRLVAEWLR